MWTFKPNDGKQRRLFFLIVGIFFLTGPVSCAIKSGEDTRLYPRTTAYLPDPANQDKLHLYAPVFLGEGTDKPYNRIGTPAAEQVEEDGEKVYIDPALPSVYVRKQYFSTRRGNYTNLIYRLHFSKVPCGPVPPHLTCGKNSGLLVYITLDSEDRPVLITTVHTCGCYLAFTPTGNLAEKSFPQDWDKAGHKVYGEVLPGRISYNKVLPGSAERLVIRFRGETHRVMDLKVCRLQEIKEDYKVEYYRQLSAESLLNIPLGDNHTSFFEESGCRKGYVKDSHKPYERLLMSWWALDWHIGEDKRLGPPGETGVVFYTSLKFWDRKESNIWYFDRFLRYWGWEL